MSAPAPVSKTKPNTPPLAVKLGVTVVAGLFLLLMVILGFIMLGPAGKGHGIFGTHAPLAADVNLIAEIVLIIGLLVGFGLALSKHISAHQYNQTTWALFNIILVVFIMVESFTQVLSGIPASLLQLHGIVATIHAILGTITVLCAVYILLRMNGLLPKPLRIKWWKNLMRFTLGMYLLVGFLGLVTYVVWYVIPAAPSGNIQTAQATPAAGTVVVPLANYTFNPGNLEIPAGTTVVFRNTDPDPHTITSDTGAFKEGQVQQGQEYSVTFNQLGDFPFFCQYHGAKGGVGMSGVIKVVAASAAVVLPTSVVPQKPTPQPTPAAPPVAAFGGLAVGFGTFVDAASHNDGFNLQVAGLPAPAGEFDAWLTGSGQPLHLGVLAPDAQGNAALQYHSPNGANLLAQFTGFSITAEAAGGAPSAPSTNVVIASTLPAGVLGPVRELLASSTSAPNHTAYAQGLVAMTEELLRHAKAVSGAAALGDFESMNRHVQHMLDILEGKTGPDYKNADVNGVVQDPGDGFGIQQYADAVGAQAAAAASASDVTPNVTAHAVEVVALAANMRDWSNRLVSLLLQATQASAATDKQSLASQALALSKKMLNGAPNANGVIDPLQKEGGAYTTYIYSQYLAALGAQPQPGSGVATPAPVVATATEVAPGATAIPGAPGATATPGAPGPTDTTAPQGTATKAPTPKPVIITYSNFVINPPSTTIKVGTTVVFVIQQGPHEPYNATGPDQFDSGSNPPLVNTTYSFTFKQAGTITILCGYHSNMSATLVIQP